ncbi:MAG: GH116 family glycosyl hydrolase, partial [Planctomycetota bacterium]|nr:GH116 family glycosyl hydrolase [Planctomycetota bacterium]
IIRSRVTHNSGIPLGGLGTGSVEIRPDGYFHEWHIFNMGLWSPNQPAKSSVQDPNLSAGALTFHLRTQQPGAAPIMRRLGMRTDQNNLYSFAWHKSVQGIEFDGRYPVANLRYLDEALPVAVEAEMFSPMIPHDSRTSGTPGFHAVFSLRNLSGSPVEVSLLSVLQNPVAAGVCDRKLSNTISREGDATYLTMRTGVKEPLQTAGSLCLGVSGGEVSWIAAETEAFFNGYAVMHWGGNDVSYGMPFESAYTNFRAAGRLPSMKAAGSPAGLLKLTDEQLAALSTAEIRQLIARMRAYPFAASMYDRIQGAEPAHLRQRDGMITFLRQVRTRLNMFFGDDRRRQTWGTGALCSSITLAPFEQREIRFVLGWHFPHHFSSRGPEIGHMYEHWFSDAHDVARFLRAGFAAHSATVGTFSDTLFETTLPEGLPEAWSGQLTTLPKCTWWDRDGRFGVWEGLGCCGFHTTDITYQGSFGILALYPDLQQAQMLMGAKFQRKDGRVHHFFTPDMTAVDTGFDRVDMNQQFVLLACRDWLWTGDKAHLRKLWPHVVRAMDCTAELDADGDGLPDHDTRRNTYDAWDFRGTPSYIASLWISALRAAARIAQDLGEIRRAGQWRRMMEKAAVNFDRKLWNGEYYSLWVEGKNRDECCMTDQIDGEWFTSLIGLGLSLPRQRVIDALGAIMRYNFNSEDGLVNATYPPRTKHRLVTDANVQATAPWTGIEYSLASMMIDLGLAAEGGAVVDNIADRHFRTGKYWNHGECGDHYYRAMSSWALLLAATGFKPDAPGKTLTFAPTAAGDCFRAPWVGARGWGRFTQTPAAFTLECLAGEANFRTLRLKLTSRAIAVTVNERKVKASFAVREGMTLVTFGRDVTLSQGDCLIVE